MAEQAVWPLRTTERLTSGAEKSRQQRSRIVQTLNVPRGYASGLHSLRPCWTAFLSTLYASDDLTLQAHAHSICRMKHFKYRVSGMVARMG